MEGGFIWHDRFMKDDMLRENDVLCFRVVEFVAFCGIGVAQKNAQSGAWDKFVGCGMFEMRVAETSEGV